MIPRGLMPGLLSSLKTRNLDKVWGHRVIWVPSFSCPYPRCSGGEGSCSECGNTFSAKLKMCYGDAQIIAHTHTLVRQSPDPFYREVLQHRWPVDAPVITGLDGTEYHLTCDFTLDGRSVIWLDGKGPKKGTRYSVSYSAYKEDSISIQHVNSSSGQLRIAETNTVQMPAQISGGTILASIPDNADCYNASQGDWFVPVDATMTFEQKLEVDLPSRKANHRFMVEVLSAYYSVKTGNKTRENIAVDVGYNFDRREWVIPDGLPEGATIGIKYIACPSYAAFLDEGEFRAPIQGDQPRVMILVRSETIW